MKFLTNPPRHLFFTGKGGVGKTSIACATAVTLASPGHRVLLVSTDPASNIAQVFGVTIGNTITAIPNAPTIFDIDSTSLPTQLAFWQRAASATRSTPHLNRIPSFAVRKAVSMRERIASSSAWAACRIPKALDWIPWESFRISAGESRWMLIGGLR